MRKYRRFLSAFLAAVTLFSMCGCSGNESAGPKEDVMPVEPVDKTVLEELIAEAESKDLTGYLNADYLQRAIDDAKAVDADEAVEKEEVDKMTETLEYAMEGLYKGDDFKDPSEFYSDNRIPDPFEYLGGGFVDSVEEWPKRAAEISAMYQHYMYGTYRDGSDEEVSYSVKPNGGNSYALTVNIKRISTGAETKFTATILMPDASIEPPEGGYPVIVGMHAGISEDTANKNGYVTITVDFFSYGVASDDTKHTGAFYELYPYGTEPDEQTGVLLAWGWGCSKILDALEAGLSEELNISAENTIVTGVSRWGKAAIVCGAFDHRFKMVAPSCSGAGGVALYRYTSEGKTYDFSTKGADSKYTYSQNEPLGSLQSSGERGWFNDMFLKFKNADTLPMDQHMLCSLVADKDRYLFIIGSCIYEDWVNAPAMWYSYLGAREVYKALGIEDNIAINIHQQGHAVIAEDIEYITDYFDYHVYGKEPELDLNDLKTSVFELDGNADPEMEDFCSWWMSP